MAVKRWSFLPIGRVASAWWLLIALVLLVADYLLGPFFQFPAVYVVPVTLAAWFSGPRTGLALAVWFPLSRLTLMLTVFDEPWTVQTTVANAVTRVSVFVVMALMASRLAEHERVLASEVETLRSLLPICTYCSKIRDGKGDEWETLDTYVSKRQGEFSPGLCPDCAQQHFPEHFSPPGVQA